MPNIRRPIVFDKRFAKISATDSDFQPDREYNSTSLISQREGIHGLREMTLVEYDNFKAWWRYLFMLSPTVSLTRVSSGGNLGTMADTRFDVGAATADAHNFDTLGELDDPQILTQASYANINQTVDTTVTEPTHLPPLLGWASSANKIQKMSVNDFYTTVSTELGKLVTQNGSGMGGYVIHDSAATTLHADSGQTNSLGSVFTDTFQTDHTSSNPTVNDTVETGITYFLHECTATGLSFTPSTFPRPVYLNGNIIREYTWLDLTNYYQDLMQFMAVHGRPDNSTGAIRYYISNNASGAGTVTLGLGMANKARQSTSRITLQYGADDYRAQEVPSGSPTALNTFSLRGTRST